MSQHRAQARKKTRIAQATAGIFAAGAAAAVLIPRPDPTMPIPKSESSRETTGKQGEGSQPAELPAQDLGTVVLVMNTLVDVKERAKPPEPAPIPETPVVAKQAEPQRDPEVTGGWRYVGSILSTKSSAAIINDEHNKQHVVFAGDTLNGTTLVSVAADHLVLRDGDEHSATRQLQLEPRPDTLLPDAPIAMASSTGMNELPPEFANIPPDLSTWPQAQQTEWSQRRAMLMKQIQDANARNAAGRQQPSNVRPIKGAPVPPGKAPTTGKDFK